MKPEDETFLSAFLDGELNADQRAAVESALVSNPALAEHLRELATVRDLVSTLPHPPLRADLSAAVVSRIRKRTESRRRALRIASAAVALGGLAAAVVLALAPDLSLPARGPAAAPGAFPTLVLNAAPGAPEQPAAAEAARLAAVDSARDTVVEPPRPGNDRSRSAVRPSPALDRATLRADRDQTRIRELLDRPDLKHVFLVLDVIGGHADEQVNDLLRRSPRLDPSYGRITVSQEIVIDPRHPNKATVFAVVMDDREMTLLQKRLSAAFPNAVEEEDVDANVVTRLSGIGDVAFLPGTHASDLVHPPEAPAFATRTQPRPKTEPVGPIVNEEFPGLPFGLAEPHPPLSENPSEAVTDPERELSAPPAGPRPSSDPPALANAAPSVPGRKTSAVLVWVTTPGINGPRRR
jgi:hypothetical protein